MWRFRQVQANEAERNPMEAELFNAARDSSAVVRETLQNSLDAFFVPAGSTAKKEVDVRFSFGSRAVTGENPYYKGWDGQPGIMDHYEQVLKVSRPSKQLPPKSNVTHERYLVIEDFGTKGLGGPLNRTELNAKQAGNKASDIETDFYNFWWREGLSDKGGINVGRFGLGKLTLYKSSEISSIYGLTVRSDDQRQLLMGKSMLRFHQLDGIDYDYAGYFGKHPADQTNPYDWVDDAEYIQEFKESYRLKRGTAPGTSIVIPLPDQSLDYGSLVREVIENYAWPIFTGSLKVSIEDIDSDVVIVVDPNSILDLVQEEYWNDANSLYRERLKKRLEFMENIVTAPDADFQALVVDVSANGITKESFGSEQHLDELQTKFEHKNDSGEYPILHFNVPVTITKSDGTSESDCFRVSLQRDDSLEKSDEIYIRGGIVIPEVTSSGGGEGFKIRALLEAGEGIVSEFLGDSENPSHTFWNERAEKLKANYQNHVSTIRFIKNSIREIKKLLHVYQADVEEDALLDYFYIEEDSAPSGSRKPRTSGPTKPPPPSTEREFRFADIVGQNGFRVQFANNPDTYPVTVRIRMGYERAIGDALKKYKVADFDVGKMPIMVHVEHGDVIAKSGNVVDITAHNGEFACSVTGFDSNRDIRSKAIIIEPT